MTATHLEILVEEPSAEAFLNELLPRLLPSDRTFAVRPFQGKDDLLRKLAARLRAYVKWLPPDWRIIVLVDRDDADCHALKSRMQTIAHTSGLRTKSRSTDWQLVNRIAIEELEAWYFGDWQAVRMVYPKVAPTVPSRAPFRISDAIQGGTWEAFERILQKHGYFAGGLRKTEAAREIGAALDPHRCCSESFIKFRDAIVDAIG
jgi:Domain of unknown function (DUF4276)